MTRISSAIDLAQVSDPATPASGRQTLYFKSDGILYTKKSDGSISPVAGAGSAPANMVTTDTTQSLTGDKTLTGRTIIQPAAEGSSGAAGISIRRQNGTEVLGVSSTGLIITGATFNGQLFGNTTGATSTNQTTTSSTALAFRTTYWNGTATVLETTEFVAGRGSTEPTDSWYGTARGLRGSHIGNTGITGATTTTRWVGSTASGAPTTGTFKIGDWVITTNAQVWVCTAAGTPGTWTQVGGGSTPTNMVTTDTTQTVTGDKTTTGLLRAAGPVNEAQSTVSRLDLGVQLGTPRLILEDARVVTTKLGRIWQVDNDNGIFRWFNPGVVQMSLTDVGDLTVTKNVVAVGDIHANNGAVKLLSSPGTGFASWIDMSTAGVAGLGSGGIGNETWIAKTSSAGQFFNNNVAGDIVYRAGVNKALLFGALGGTDVAPTTSDWTLRVSNGTVEARGPGGLLDNGNRAYSDSNPPQSLEREILPSGPTPANNPLAGRSWEWTPDGKSLWMEAPDGTQTKIGPAPAGGAGSAPAWAGVIHTSTGDGEPEWEWQWNNLWGPGTTALTPTGVTATVGRVWSYRSIHAITLRRLRWFAVAGTAASSTFRFAMYNATTGAQVLAPQTLVFTGADRWTSIPINGTTGIALAADQPYYCALSATATATTWSLKAAGLPVTYPPIASQTPDNFDFPGVGANRTWFGQVAVTAGALPATLTSANIARGAAWTVGGVPAFLFGSSTAA